MSLLELREVVQSHPQGPRGRRVEALRVGRLAVRPAEILAVIGGNGAGKSTLLETLAFLRRPEQGRVLLAGEDPWADGRALAARRRCPILLQRTVLFDTTVLGNAAFGPRVVGHPRAEALRRGRAALARVGLAGFEGRHHRELSGGEARRVALARVLALEAAVLVLDEPTAGLDAEAAEGVDALLRALARERGTAVILASHDVKRAVELADRVVTLVDGRLVHAHLDNRSLGALARRGAGWAYEDHAGWRHTFAPADLALDAYTGVGPREGPVEIGVPALGVRLDPCRAGEPPGLVGEVDAIRREGSLCRVRVRLPPRQLVRARLPLEQVQSMGLALGARVALGFAEGAVHVLPRGEARGP